MATVSDLTKTSPDMSAPAVLPPKEEKTTATAPKETNLQQWYKSANDVLVVPVRRKRMPAGRHSVVVSPPTAKAEAAKAQGEARKQ